jgi:hypothetical protein
MRKLEIALENLNNAKDLEIDEYIHAVESIKRVESALRTLRNFLRR